MGITCSNFNAFKKYLVEAESGRNRHIETEVIDSFQLCWKALKTAVKIF